MKAKLHSKILNHGAHGVKRPAAVFLAVCALWLAATFAAQAAPCVTNITTAVSGTNVTINYTLSDSNFTSANVYVIVSADHGSNWTVPATNFSGAVGQGLAVSSTPVVNQVVWNAGTDWPGQYSTGCRARVIASDNGMVLVPAGSYLRGNPPALGDSDITDAPQYSVFVNPFLMDNNPVSYAQWQTVYNWATNHGYSFDNPGSGKAWNHPVVNISFYDAMKWCNARSEMEGITPAYWAGANCFRTAYPTSQMGGESLGVGACFNGYRLPTEAEWEKAARGGLSGQRFPWGNTISETQANYNANSSISYDTGPNTGYNPNYDTGGYPYTSPVGSFATNGYGLFDMAGNVQEWCYDYYGATSYTSGQINPGINNFFYFLGGENVVTRGGSWTNLASVARSAARSQAGMTNAFNTVGFRCVRGF
jgi:formylglycine-generating enzyme required for sulfatase activity